MCPDRHLLSLYADRELPSPWKEKLEAHLSECPACSSRLGLYRLVSMEGKHEGDTRLLDAKERVWERLSKTCTTSHTTTSFVLPNLRHLSVPLPAAAAALVIVALVAAFLGGPILASRNQEQLMAQIGTEVPGIIPVSDMTSVLKYLETQDIGADIMIIRLPETSSFISSGEPALIKATDYTRRTIP